MKYRLRFLTGDLKDQSFPIAQDSICIGRSHTNDIVLKSPDISRKHVIISNHGNGLYLDNISTRSTEYGASPLKMGDSVPLVIDVPVKLGTENSFVMEPEPGSPIEADDDATQLTNGNDMQTSPGDTHAAVTAETEMQNFRFMKETFSERSRTEEKPAEDSFAEPEADETIGLKTRMASPEEIEFAKKSEQKKLLLRRLLCIGTVAVFLILMGLYCYFTLFRAPEEHLSWPQDKNGRDMEGFIQVNAQYFPFSRFMRIRFPKLPRTRVEEQKGCVAISTFIGENRNVPLRIQLEYFRSEKELHQDREVSLEQWMERKSTGKSSCNFDMPSPLMFFAHDNGIPYHLVSYTRTEQHVAKFGYVRFLRIEDWVLAFIVEIDAKERWRGEEFLLRTFLQFGPSLQYEHWEGMNFSGTVSLDDKLYEARNLLGRKSPTSWERIYYLLRQVLICSRGSNSRESYSEAKKLLKELRLNQIKWFNEQKLSYWRAQTNDDKEEMKRIKESCCAVFSSKEDRRFNIIRQDQWW